MYCIGTNLLYGGLQYLYIHTCGTHLRSTACNSCVPPKEFRSVLYSSRRDGHYGDATESGRLVGTRQLMDVVNDRGSVGNIYG